MSYKIPMKKVKEKESFSVENKKYNGWTNFETWQVALNIDNDEGVYHMSRDAIKDGTIHDGESYKEWFKEIAESKEEGYYKLFDGWSENELKEVNWEEIYKSHKEEY